MDSISQVALGAAIAEITLGKHLGARAMLLGAALGTLPDLDVVIQYADAVESFTYHRSWSHSLFVLSVLSLPLACALMRVIKPAPLRHDPLQSLTLWQWWLAVWLILITHPLLDAFTIYGTQLWWPLPVRPVAIGSIFIIDPLYTLPLLAGLIAAWRSHRNWTIGLQRANPWRHSALNIAGLILSTTYLVWTLVAQQHARQVALASLEFNQITPHKLLVAPSPLSLLWRFVALTDEHYLEGYYSFLDRSKSIQFDSYDKQINLLGAMSTHWPVGRLDWFTDGFIAADKRDNELIISDLRMGLEASYVFEFSVAQWQDEHWVPSASRLLPLIIVPARASQVWQRIWDDTVEMFP